jgi:hypothetical protein
MNDELALQLWLLPRWMPYAHDPDTADVEIAAAVDLEIARQPRLAAERDLLVGLLTDKSADARRRAAGLGALRWEEHPVLGRSVASMIGWLLDRDPTRTAAEERDALLATLTEPTDIDHVPPRVEPVTLPYGPGVRVEAVRSEPTGDAPVFSMIEYHVPLARPRASTLLVRFVTCHLALVDELADEFDLIVAKLDLSVAGGAGAR